MRASVLLSVALLGWSVVANLVIGDRGYVWRNLLLAALLLWLGHRGGLADRDLGLESRRVASGARWGLGAAGIVAVALVGAVALVDVVPLVGNLLADERAAVSHGELVHAAAVRIPLGTAVFEEIAFRGVLLGALLRTVSVGRAVAVSSAVFGLWHLPPTWVTLELNGIAGGSPEGVTALIGSVVVTAIAGGVFCWLRLRSRSLLAPVVAHWATNALALLAAAAVGTSGA